MTKKTAVPGMPDAGGIHDQLVGVEKVSSDSMANDNEARSGIVAGGENEDEWLGWDSWMMIMK